MSDIPQPMIGQVMMFAGDYEPEGWLFCDGRQLAVADYELLFQVIGSAFGGDGTIHFNLPDMRGRIPLGHPFPGIYEGQEYTTLTEQNLPPHNHKIFVSSGEGGQLSPTGNYLGKSDIYSSITDQSLMNEAFLEYTGGGEPFRIVQPVMPVNFIIAAAGFLAPAP